MIKVVIFDCVGILTNQEPLSVGLARDYNISLEDSLPFFTGVLQECIAGKHDLKDILQPYLEKWGWNTGVDNLLKYWFERDHKLNTQLISYIQDLRNKEIQCLMATNNEKYRFAYMSEKMGFSNMFDKLYCSALIGHKKPSVEFYQKIFNDLNNIQKEEILFLDDKLENIETARNFGIHAEQYTTFESFKETMNKYLI